MNNLARTFVDLYYELAFVDEDYAEPEWSLRRSGEMLQAVQNDFTDEERSAVESAAADKLRELLRDPDEHGYTPRSLVSQEQRDFLLAVSEGRFDGAPAT